MATAIFDATLPTQSGSLKIGGPQHSGDKECRIVAMGGYGANLISGVSLDVHQLDALINTLQALRHTMAEK